ncbi:MAG TPA: hypothetical protein VGO55_00320 [Allosphingosinicella sp.]|nr:hypothetical protein [Allosphingosinicella sp.]
MKMASMRYVAPALLALCAGASQAAAQLSPGRTMTQADVDAAFARDRPLVEGFLAVLGTAAPSSWQPGSYSWYAGDGRPWQTITRARFAEIGEVGGQITLTSGRGMPTLAYNGVSVQWNCASPAAAARRLIGFFNFEHGGGDVELSPDTVTEPR